MAISSISGGGNRGSTTTLNAFYNIPGINLPNNGHESSKHGLVLASISHTLKFSSIRKSNPNISKENYFLFLSICVYVALIASVANFFISG